MPTTGVWGNSKRLFRSPPGRVGLAKGWLISPRSPKMFTPKVLFYEYDYEVIYAGERDILSKEWIGLTICALKETGSPAVKTGPPTTFHFRSPVEI